MVDIIVPVFNLVELTKDFVESVQKQNNYNLILIDNGSDRPARDYLRSLVTQGIATVIRNDENLGYIKAINQGLRLSSSPLVLFCNNDTVMPIGLLDKLREGARYYDIVAPLTNNVSNAPNRLLVSYPFATLSKLELFAKSIAKTNKNKHEAAEFVFGHCMLVKKEVLESIGGLDERFGMGNYDDLDFCERARRQGFRIGLIKYAFIYHHCHATFNASGIDVDALISTNQEVYDKKWK